MALSAPKRITSRDGDRFSYEMAASTTIHRGGLVVLDTGYAKPATAAASLKAVGVADESVSNGGAAGAMRIAVKRGVFLFRNDGTNPVARTHIGTSCHIVDDETVSSSATGTSPAGTVREVGAEGVWVEI